MKIIILIIFLIISAVVLISVIDNSRLTVTGYTVTSDKTNRDCRIAFLSDLHGNKFGDENEKLIEAVKKSRPDIVIMGGDMISSIAGRVNRKIIDDVASLVEAFDDHKVYYGIGNHEYRMDIYREDFGDNYDDLMEAVYNAGAVILWDNNEYLEDMNIELQGLQIDREFYSRGRRVKMPPDYMKEKTGERDTGRFRILLAHNPEYFEAYSKEADLVLSGHCHGGIVRLPILGGMISPRLRPFPRYDGGIYELNGSTMIVSKGLGSHTIPIRVFNPCELCIIDIKKAYKHRSSLTCK